MHSVSLQNYSQCHISAYIYLQGSEVPWKFTGFYGHQDKAQRDDSWKILSFLHRLQPSAWLCMGDFNELWTTPKSRGLPRPHKQMESFCKVLFYCNLGDLGFCGSKYTWSNKRESGVYVKERLDRALVTPEWGGLFPNAAVEVLAGFCSDHQPLWLWFDPSYRSVPRMFATRPVGI
jgi:endonuclease/exonuclease/phosphatase family metal-dependent hydrolase